MPDNEKYEMIPKEKMIAGRWYQGVCRNATMALWDGKENKFTYIRYKFGFMLDDIEHFEDVKDKGYDGFIPIKEVEPLDFGMIRKLKNEIGY